MKETKIFISPTIHQLKKKPIDSNFQLLSSKTDCHSQNPRIRRRLKKKIHVKTVEDCRESYKKDKYVSTFSFFFFLRRSIKTILAFPEFSPSASKTSGGLDIFSVTTSRLVTRVF